MKFLVDAHLPRRLAHWLGERGHETGNIKNAQLEELFHRNIAQIVEAFETYDFVEIDRTTLIFHM